MAYLEIMRHGGEREREISTGGIWRTLLRIRGSYTVPMVQSRIPPMIPEYNRHVSRMPYTEPIYFGIDH